jgi:hypothetical protein
MTSDGPRLIRAAYTAQTITVYQAYTAQIAEQAVRAGTFTGGFSRDRMTWIKPSFGWMMHRSGWGRKPGQERVLAIEITRSGWEWALGHSCLSHYAPRAYDSREAWSAAKTSSLVRVQWDPDRAPTGEALRWAADASGRLGWLIGREFLHHERSPGMTCLSAWPAGGQGLPVGCPARRQPWRGQRQHRCPLRQPAGRQPRHRGHRC